jgi:dTDP-4-dehydrorhamnose 3,5-epimerase
MIDHKMEIRETEIPGCYEVQPRLLKDDRGVFVKTFHAEEFRSLGLCADWKEQYYSASNQGVLRGLHFQHPPHDHAKLVYCTIGSVEDVVLDIRAGSPTYGKSIVLELSAAKGNMIYLPKGLAHGFCTPSEPATLVYNVSSIYEPDADSGIRWDSIGVRWSIRSPLLSNRDLTFPALDEFQSPFHYSEPTEHTQ